MCLSLEHDIKTSKTSEKMGHFDRVTVSLHMLCTANQETARVWLAVTDFQSGEQQSRSGSDKKRRYRLQ